MGRPTTFLILFAFAGVPVSLFYWSRNGSVWAGIIVGVLIGAVFALSIYFVSVFLEKSTAMGLAKTEGWGADEMIIYSDVANMVKKIEVSGGKLYLTNKRLRFCAHRVNIDVGDYSFPLGTLSEVERANMFGIIPNGIVIKFSDGRRVKFVVYSRDNWIKNINRECGI